MSKASKSLSRAMAIAGNTFREAVRMRLFLLLSFVAMISLAGGFIFKEFNFGASELKFIADFGFGGMTLFGSIVAVVVSVQLFYGEIEHRTILPLLAKPVNRGEFVVGKLIGSWLTVCAFVLVLTLSLLLALWARETQLMNAFPDQFPEGRVVPYWGIALFGFLQSLRLAILSSVAGFFAAYATSSVFAIFMGFFVWTIGQLQTVAIEQLQRTESWMLEAFLRFISFAVPDFRVFDVGEELLEGAVIQSGDVARLAVYAALYVALYSSLAAMILNKREL